jgi:GNAT superfamily N-acetyltransferase
LKPPKDTLRFRDTNIADTANLNALAQLTLNTELDDAFIRWKYFHNPAGINYGRCAVSNGIPAGFFGNIPINLHFGKEVIKCAQAVDAMVAPQFRRQGLFTELGRQTYQKLDQDGFALTYTFPNPISEAGVLKHLDWTAVGRVPRYINILDLDAFLERGAHQGLKAAAYRLLLGGTKPSYRRTGSSNVRISRVNAFDKRVDRLWEQIAPDLRIAVKRDYTYLKWRYIENPLPQYQILIAEQGSELSGYIVLSSRDLIIRKAVAVAEFMVLPGDQAAGLALLEEATILVKEMGCATLECWMLPQHSFYTSLLKGSGFIYSNKGYMPGLVKYTTPFIIRPHPRLQLSPDPGDIENWFLTMGDHDYY